MADRETFLQFKRRGQQERQLKRGLEAGPEPPTTGHAYRESVRYDDDVTARSLARTEQPPIAAEANYLADVLQAKREGRPRPIFPSTSERRARR